MAQRERKQWRPFYKYKGAPPPIAEPLHRMGPEGVSSGISARELPRVSVEQLRKICDHYVTKCSGKYENNVVAARYVYEMADEILSQLSALEAYCKQEREMAASLHEVFDEWERYFPLELQQNTPAAISARLRDQQQQIAQLTRELEHSRRKHEEDVQQLQHVLDQLQNTAKVSQAHDRQRQQERLRELASQYTAEQAAKQGELEQRLQELQQENLELNRRLAEQEAQRSADRQMHDEQLDRETRALRERYLGEIDALHKELATIRNSAAAARQQSQQPQPQQPQQQRSPGRPSPPRPASSSAAGGFGVDRPPAAAAEPERRRPGPAPTRQSTQSVQSTLSSQSRTDAASSSLSRTPPRPQSRPSGGRQAPQPSVEAAHTFPPSQQLRHRISELESTMAARDATIRELKDRNTELGNENTRLRRRIAAVEDTNWHMREALKNRLNIDIPENRTGSFGGSRPVDFEMSHRHGSDPRIAGLDAPATSWSQREIMRPDHEEFKRDKEFWVDGAYGAHPLFSVVV